MAECVDPPGSCGPPWRCDCVFHSAPQRTKCTIDALGRRQRASHVSARALYCCSFPGITSSCVHIGRLESEFCNHIPFLLLIDFELILLSLTTIYHQREAVLLLLNAVATQQVLAIDQTVDATLDASLVTAVNQLDRTKILLSSPT